ncbi:MAG: hypothetical protein R3C56_15860 [Pirellulaceae bacterium]
MSGWIDSIIGSEMAEREFPKSMMLYALFDAILYPSTAWAILNLAPILPLDGGQVMRSGLMLSRAHDPMRVAHIVSIGAGVLLGIYFMQNGEMFGLMFFLFAASNWQAMQYGSRGY